MCYNICVEVIKMKKQKNIRLDESALNKVNEIANEYGVSDTEVINRAIWLMADVLYEGEEYSNKISSLKRSIELMWR